MNIFELFSGTASFSKVAAKRGHECRTLDNNPKFNPTYCMDIMDFTSEILGDWQPDIIWASPPCQCFSVLVIGRNWIKKPFKSPIPKRPETIKAIWIIKKTLELIKELKPKYYFIENPRAMLRKMPFMRGWHKSTITYCQYGFDYQKATDIWNNCYQWKPKPLCFSGSPCHQRAPRGAHTGLKGIGKYAGIRRTSLYPRDMGNESRIAASVRAIVPPKLCEEIIIACEKE